MKMKSKNFRCGINNANGNDFAHLGKMGKGMFFSLIMLALALVACDRDEVFEKEQYKNVFALISENDNVSRKFHLLGKESVGFVGGDKSDNKEYCGENGGGPVLFKCFQ